jgi:hypothetical protein
VTGTIACQESSGRLKAYETGRCGTRAAWLKLDCLYHNLQKVQLHARRKTSETGAAFCTGLISWPVQPSECGAMPDEGI